MRNTGILAVGLVVLVAAFFLIKGSGSEKSDDVPTTTAAQTTATPPSPDSSTAASTPTPTTPAVQSVTVQDAKPQGGIKKLEFKRGEQATFKVTSDVADEVHFHGYDIMEDVKAGGSVTFKFKADREGRFEVELEDRGTQIASVEVR